MSVSDSVRARREKIVRDHMADENAHAFNAVLATFPHPHYELIPTGDVYDGRDTVSSYYQDSRRAFPDQRNEILSLRHADDAVIVEFWLRGTHQGPYKGMPPTGQSFEVQMTAFFIFEEEKLVCERVYFDSLTMLRQLLSGISLSKPSSVLTALRVLGALLNRK